MKIICETLLNSKSRKSFPSAVVYIAEGATINLSWDEYFEKIESAACGLLDIGIKRGDRVAILANTRVEWAITDLAALSIGAVSVPIYQSSLAEEVAFVIKDSESKILICENEVQYAKWTQIEKNCPSVQNVITLSGRQGISWSSFITRGQSYRTKNPDVFKKSISSLSSSDPATVIYTSGTTGLPKGVLLTHEQLTSEVSEALALFDITPKDRSLTFLPFAHIFGRVEMWSHLAYGFTMGYAESIEKIASNLQTLRPTFFVGVPRIFEKFYNAINAKMDAHPIKKKLFDWATGVASEIADLRLEKKSVPFQLLAQYRVAQKLVFSKVLENLGGNLRFCVVGGAAMNKDIARFFYSIGLTIYEGYGLTETTAAVLCNRPYDFKFGSAGKIFGDVQVKLAEDGEIMIKSKKVMSEYYKNPTATAEAIKNGWFYTGDVGKITDDGFVIITDRKKDLIKTAGGKYVAPQKLENLLRAHTIVSNVLIHGEKRKYIVALLTLNIPLLEEFAKTQAIHYAQPTDLLTHPRVKELVRKVIAQVNAGLASYETIKNFAILPTEFTVESGELTPSLKVKRKFCDQKYNDVIEGLYGLSAEANP